jgi:hypothetical protein
MQYLTYLFISINKPQDIDAMLSLIGGDLPFLRSMIRSITIRAKNHDEAWKSIDKLQDL